MPTFRSTNPVPLPTYVCLHPQISASSCTPPIESGYALEGVCGGLRLQIGGGRFCLCLGADEVGLSWVLALVGLGSEEGERGRDVWPFTPLQVRVLLSSMRVIVAAVTMVNTDQRSFLAQFLSLTCFCGNFMLSPVHDTHHSAFISLRQTTDRYLIRHFLFFFSNQKWSASWERAAGICGSVGGGVR
jgi:hypothetical protein